MYIYACVYVYVYLKGYNLVILGYPACKRKVFRVKMARENQKGSCMWVPQKNKPQILIH